MEGNGFVLFVLSLTIFGLALFNPLSQVKIIGKYVGEREYQTPLNTFNKWLVWIMRSGNQAKEMWWK